MNANVSQTQMFYFRPLEENQYVGTLVHYFVMPACLHTHISTVA